MSFIFLNNKFIEEKHALISVFDRGLLYGDGLFETFKSKKGNIILFKEHIARLKKSLKTLKIEMPKVDFEKKIKTLLKKNNLLNCNANVRITITRGTEKGTYLPSKKLSPTIIISAKKINEKQLAQLRKEGIKIITLKDSYIPGTADVKTINFIPNILGKIKAKENNAYEGIFVNSKNHITEGTSSNVFLFKNKTLYTPPLSYNDKNILPGIMRKEVIKKAKKLKIKVTEKTLKEKDMIKADSIFITNSIIEILPVKSVNSIKKTMDIKTNKETNDLIKEISII